MSIDPPSRMPPAIALTKEILVDVCSQNRNLAEVLLPHGDSLTESPLLMCFRRIERDLFGVDREHLKQTLRLEVVLELLYESFGTEALECLSFMKNCEPNVNHEFAATLYAKGCSIITTNFDVALERAIVQTGMMPHVITALDNHDCLQERGPFLMKIHGSIVDLETLGATISRLEAGLPPTTEMFLRRFLKNKHLVFMGYSGSDQFDISPFLLNAPIWKATWVNHRNVDTLFVWDHADLSLGRHDEPGGPQFHREFLRTAEHRWLIEGKTHQFRDLMHERLLDVKPAVNEPTEVKCHAWKECVRNWSKSLNPALAAATMGRLAQQIGLARTAEACYEAMQHCPEYRGLPPARRAFVEMNREYLLSVLGLYRTREEFLTAFKKRWSSERLYSKDQKTLLDLMIYKKRASCRIFNDRIISAAWYILAALTFGLSAMLRHGQIVSLRNRVIREIHELGTEVNFMLRIFPRRWFFHLPVPLLKFFRNTEQAFMRVIYSATRKGGMANTVRSLQYRGRTELRDILGAPRYYMELENLLGLTNSLREAALLHVLNYRQSGSQIDLQEAESLLEKSVLISKEIGDNPGLAKGYHHLCWIAMTSDKQSQFEEKRVLAEYYLGLVEAPRWARRRLKDLRIWARNIHPKPSDLNRRM